MTEPIIRRATAADVPALVELRRRFKFQEDGDGSAVERRSYAADCTEFYARAVQGDGWLVWVADASGEVVSNATVVLFDKVPHPFSRPQKLSYLTNVYTVPEWRGQGIAGRMIHEAKASAEAAGAELILVWPSKKSVSLYERYGFEAQLKPLVCDLE